MLVKIQPAELVSEEEHTKKRKAVAISGEEDETGIEMHGGFSCFVFFVPI